MTAEQLLERRSEIMDKMFELEKELDRIQDQLMYIGDDED